MNFDLDQFDSICGWELKIKALGKEYLTRPLTIQDAARLQKLVSGDGGLDQIVAVLQSLFVGDAPPLEKMRLEKLLALIGAVLQYWRGQVAKNSPAIADAVSSAMANEDQAVKPTAALTMTAGGDGGSSTPA